jgi:hypothetical protein
MLAVFVLDASKDGELTPRSQVNLELPDPVHDVIVDALGVRTGRRVLTRLPVTLQDVSATGRLRDELSVGRSRGKDHQEQGTQTTATPESLGRQRLHIAPYS